MLGETYRSLSYAWRVHESTIRLIVLDTCQAIYTELQPRFMQVIYCAHAEIFGNYFEQIISKRIFMQILMLN